MSIENSYHIDELKRISIKLLASAEGLERGPWEYVRGAKTERLYKNSNDNTIIKVSYTYSYDEGYRKVISLEEKIEFFKDSGEIFLTIPLDNNFDSKKLNRTIRQYQIDYLESKAEDLKALAAASPEPEKTQYNTVADNIEAIFSHYKLQVEAYISRGTMELEDAINNEADVNMNSILDNPVRPPDSTFPNGLTARQAVLYQLTGVIP